MTVREQWGDELRLERQRRRLRQSDVAELADVAIPTVHKAETGRGSVDVFAAIAAALGVTLSTPEPEQVP